MNEIIEATQSKLDTAQQRLSCVEDTVVGLYDNPTSNQLRKIRETIDRAIEALQDAAATLGAAEASVAISQAERR